MNERIVYIDWLRIVAAFMVVIIHTSGMLYMDCPKGPSEYYLGFWSGELVRSAVPIFFMISGALLLRPGYDASPKKMVRKALKVLALMLIWSFVYAILTLHPFESHELSIKGVIFSTIKGPFHFWFFEILIGLYLLTPVFKAITEYKEGVIVKYYIALFVLFGIIISSLQSIPYCHKWIMDVTSKISVEWLGFAGYFFLGHYLDQKRYVVSTWGVILIFIGAVLLQGFVFTNMGLLYSSDKFWWLTIVEASALFVLFANCQLLRTAGEGVKLWSSFAMGVYIIHPFILEHIPMNWWNASLYGVDVLLVYGGALALSYIIMKIPIAGKWLLSI